ncbi:ABC transporter substrate-binding protein [Pseudonocardia sp. HH130630-07]|nr:MCE family protein [Pseudonocardia sp. HH130630-07]ANY07385.1 ABC transporter substrate-binding protein [Pseudonocardia sp. HH130630-07]
MTRFPLSPLLKFLVFALVTALGTTVLGLTIANARGGEVTPYTARFTDATGLLAGDDVRISGVVVGSVTDVRIVDQRVAEVEFDVDSATDLPATVNATLKYRNLIGQRYLALDQGAGPTGQTLPAGGQIPLDRTRPAVNLTVLFNGFQPLFQGLDPVQINKLSMEIVQVLQGEGGTVQSLLASTSSLTNSVADRDRVIGQVIDNLNLTLQTVNENDEGLDELISSLQAVVSGLARDREPIGDAISSIGTLTQVTGSFVEDARPALRDDIRNLGDLATELDRGRPAVERFLEYAPFKLNRIARVGSYGSWFNFYLCGLDGQIGISPILPPTSLEDLGLDLRNPERRCGPDPSGLGPGGTGPTGGAGDATGDNRAQEAERNPLLRTPDTESLQRLADPLSGVLGAATDSSADPTAALQPGGN